nr:hypothetical protein [Arthrospira sp. PLM2.Bin9]
MLNVGPFILSPPINKITCDFSGAIAFRLAMLVREVLATTPTMTRKLSLRVDDV